MNDILIKNQKNIYRLAFWIILVMGCFFRILWLGKVPGGVHPDEAFAGYEAYSMLKYGVDSWGYRLPVYFVSWGSGMNVLESYMMMPFVAMLGLNEISIRIPQVMMAIVSIPAVYFLLRRTGKEKLALTGMFITAISPWHFMFSRWGCESNMCPAMLLLGSLFLLDAMSRILAKDKGIIRSFILSAVFFGLDLYCYAATWILVAAILIVWAAYFLFYCRANGIKFNKVAVQGIAIFACILFVMALPLLLFIMVNLEIISEIRSFISIPKMIVFRGDEVMDTSVLWGRIRYLAHILVAQEDGRPWNAISPYGLFYTKISIPVILLGVVKVLIQVVKDFKEKKLSYSFILVIYASIATVLVIVQRVDIISSNYLQICLIIFWAAGVYAFAHLCKGWIYRGVILAYIIAFGLFLNTYFTAFAQSINETQMFGARDAILTARWLYDSGNVSGIALPDSISHAQALFYTKYPVDEYMESVQWKVFPDRYLAAKSFGPFVWDADEFDESMIHIIKAEQVVDYEEHGFVIMQFDDAYLAY